MNTINPRPMPDYKKMYVWGFLILAIFWIPAASIYFLGSESSQGAPSVIARILFLIGMGISGILFWKGSHHPTR